MVQKRTLFLKAAALCITLLATTAMVYGSGSHAGGHGKSMPMKNHWTSPDEALKQVNPVAVDKTSVAQGKKLYFDFCAGCHGDNAKGNGPYAASLSTKPSDLKAMSGGHEDGDFAWKIKNGRGDMPAWKDDLTTDEIWTLVNYIQSLGQKGAHHN